MTVSDKTQGYALLAARVLMASLFLWSGSKKLFDMRGVAYFATAHGVPYATVLMPVVVAFELIAGLALLSGWRAREAAVALAVWMAVLGPWFHQFWNAPPALWQVMIDDFFHHLVMIGGMVYVAIFGPGRLTLGGRSTDRRF